MLTNGQRVATRHRVSSVLEPTQRKSYALLSVKDPFKRVKTTVIHS